MAFHESCRTLEDAIALIFVGAARLDPGLFADDAVTLDLVIFAEADGIMNPPQPGQQLGRAAANVLNPDRVGEHKMTE